jgi:hypothetical protein
MLLCFVCQAPAPYRCSRCSATYCSHEHQMEDWRLHHKVVCEDPDALPLMQALHRASANKLTVRWFGDMGRGIVATQVLPKGTVVRVDDKAVVLDFPHDVQAVAHMHTTLPLMRHLFGATTRDVSKALAMHSTADSDPRKVFSDLLKLNWWRTVQHLFNRRTALPHVLTTEPPPGFDATLVGLLLMTAASMRCPEAHAWTMAATMTFHKTEVMAVMKGIVASLETKAGGEGETLGGTHGDRNLAWQTKQSMCFTFRDVGKVPQKDKKAALLRAALEQTLGTYLILQRNAFPVSLDIKEGQLHVLNKLMFFSVLGALLNHSCRSPNCTLTVSGTLRECPNDFYLHHCEASVVITGEVLAGQQLLHTYVSGCGTSGDSDHRDALWSIYEIGCCSASRSRTPKTAKASRDPTAPHDGDACDTCVWAVSSSVRKALAKKAMAWKVCMPMVLEALLEDPWLKREGDICSRFSV